MKILAIRGRNLASLEGDFVLDFTTEPLLSTGIFAISGPTGAGKSTLLDAMCLALFARTPRTDLAKENNVKLKDVNEDVLMQGDPRFLLRRGTASGYAEVDFVALDGHRYRSRWAVGRARDKENGRLQNIRLTLHNLDKEQEEQGSRSDLQARIIELIGLTFEQFTRSVLLAQNDFSTFLKAEQGEKASLLEKLTGTEQYSAISRLIFEKNAAAREAFDKIAVQIEGIELLTEEDEQLFRLRLAEAEAASLRLEKAKAERQALQDALKSTEQQIALKQSQQKEAVVKGTEATSLLAAAHKEYEQGLEEQQRSETRFKSLQTELQEARKLDVQMDSLTRIVAESEAKWKEACKRKKEGEEKHQSALLRQTKAVREIAELTAWQERYRSKEGIAAQLTALLLYLDAASTARLAAEKAHSKKVSIQKTMEKQAAELQKMQQSVEARRADYQRTETEMQTLSALLNEAAQATLDEEMTVARAERERLLIEQAQFVTTGDIAALRDKLTDGVPCPVCGSKQHPYATHEAGERLLALSKDIAAVTFLLQKLSKQQEALASRQKQLSRLQQQQLLLQKEVAEGERLSADLLSRQQVAANQLTHEETTYQEQSALLTQSLSAANTLFGNDEWQKGWKEAPEAFRNTLTDFARRWQENGLKLQKAGQQLSSCQAESESLASFLPPLSRNVEEAAQLYDENRKASSLLHAERAKLFAGKPADAVEQEYTRSNEALRERLKRLLATQTEQSARAEQLQGVAVQIEQDLMTFSQDRQQRGEALEAWLNEFTSFYEGRSLEEMLRQAVQEKTEYAFRLRTHTENKKKVAGLQTELTVRREVSERWAKLNELAGSADGAKFRRIAQGYTLDVLLNYANVQLRGLSRRYYLERVPDTLALQVIDRDMCDEVRTVHSLSGGESFLVSLALALGLSSLSSNRMKVESLFIDEGFGSLDADTLRMAMDALETLHTQGRKIGVISHVQEMTERIPVQVKVSRAGNGRSYLEVMPNTWH